MAALKILNLKYIGDNYFYESPTFTTGLNILEGHNGAGKSTFMDLLYYSFGGTVLSFTNEEKKQIEIYNDKNNLVEVTIQIDGIKYTISRYIKSNTIAVQSNGEITSYPVYRTNDEDIFSDWILEALNISVFSVYQGISDWKINFLDLMRLIYHDQADFLGEVYKKPDKKENFINDSPVIKKAIFEVLLGHHGDKYYNAFNGLKEIEKEKNLTNSSYQKYKEIAENLRYTNNWRELNLVHLDSEIKEINIKIDKLVSYKENLREKPKTLETEGNKIEKIKNKIIIFENELDVLRNRIFYLSKELKNIDNVYLETLNEISSLEKILFTHDTFDFFHSNTCPICLKESNYSDDVCICGNKIEEDERNTIFYEADEYLDLLKSKKKSIATIQLARINCIEEIEHIKKKEENIKDKVDNFRKEIESIVKTIDYRFDNSQLIDTEKEILLLQNKRNSFAQQRSVEKHLSDIEKQLNDLKKRYKEQNAIVRKLGAELEIELSSKLKDFNSKYNNFLKETLENCRNAFLNEDYYPVINGGTYREKSAIVPIRLMYYLTFLTLSIEREDLAFPKILLIDTPETAGIDDENLLKCLNQIKNIERLETDSQIIMTTGLKKYPVEYKNSVLQTFNDGEYLLQKKI